MERGGMHMNPAETTAPGATASVLIVVRAEPPGQFTAEAVGIAEIRATADSRELAMHEVRRILAQWFAEGKIVRVDVPQENAWLKLVDFIDPDDPVEREFLEILEEQRRADLEQTLKEYEDEEC